MSWHGVHIHYHDPQDRLLLEGVMPVVTWCGTRLSQWFFLRYWKDGPHVRLRLKLPAEDADAMMAEVSARLAAYLARNPSTSRLAPDRFSHIHRLLGDLQGEDREPYELVPNNALRLQRYEPEYAKYGGEAGVALAERLFEVSSRVCVELLATLGDASPRRLATGFVMLLGALRAAGMSDEAAICHFLARYCRFWSRYVPAGSAASWPKQLAGLRPTLEAHARSVLSGQIAITGAWGAAIERWLAAIRSAMATLDTHATSILPGVTMLGSDASSERRRQFVLVNYLHTHNNRLGVIPAQEAYLAYLGHHVVAQLTGIRPGYDLATTGPAPGSSP